ncbi:MAG TPA: amidase [Frankiaceae bacterium]|jgi:Asp-tRNA(Asn)/Glu-tRNA(Gln) amidotransferase A subunit family amidase|nr:amidase [Frankiaceae bacterium]
MSAVSDAALGSLRVGPQLLLPGAGGGPLSGLTFVAKDLFDVASHRTGAGNPTWLAEARPARRSAVAVTQLVAAGATCVGKSHTDEFAYSLEGRNAHYGIPHNTAAPWCAPGGSSSGTAAAVAGGLVPFGLGTDTGGSIRVPSSYCGLVGLRPTHGIISDAGVFPLAPSFDTVGWIAADAVTARRVGDVLLPADHAPPPQRLAIVADAEQTVGPQVWSAFVAAAERLARHLELPLDSIPLPGAPFDTWLATFRTVQSAEAHGVHGGWIAAHPGALSPDCEARFGMGGAVSPSDRSAAEGRRAELRSALNQVLTVAPTVLLIPSAAGPATPLAATAEELAAIRPATLRLTCVASIGGVPALSLPLAEVDGLPVGICLIGAPGSDRSLLDLAVA